MLIIPFLLLSFLNPCGLWLVLILTLLLFVEWPLSAVLRWPPLIAAAILGRTALFVVVGVMLFRKNWPPGTPLATETPRSTEDYIP